MYKEFVQYPEALELKHLGFNESCIGYLEPDGRLVYSNIKNTNFFWAELPIISAPTYSQAFKFFREYQDWALDSWIQPHLSEQPKQYQAFYWTRGETVSVGFFSTHSQAELGLLRKLIEIAKNK